ncbi:MAG TPA: ATP-binding protein [Thermoanaerobaculia bacterium]
MNGARQRRRGLGLRQEVLILLPASLVLLAALSTFTVFAYRSALALLAEERREEAAELARSVAAALGGPEATPGPGALRRLAPGAAAVAVLAADGQVLAAAGEPPDGAVAGVAPLDGGRVVRVHLPAAVLAGSARAARVLTVVVLAVNGALILLVLAFLRHLLAPYDTLLARARAVGDPAAPEGDEAEFLVATFERALAAMAGAEARSAEDDIATLERTLVGSLQSGLLLLDAAGEVLALNTVGARLLDVEPPEPGRPLAEVLAGRPELLALLTEAVAHGRELQRQEVTLRRAGGPLTLGLSVHPLRRGDGAARGFLVLFADLTEARREADQSRLAESLTRLGEMAGGVAHELRNSLATLRGYLTLIERRPDEQAVADFLGEIRRETDHLERVLEDFLAFARPGTARIEELSLPALLRRAAADPALDGVAVELAGIEEEEPRLAGDPQLLERALRNLLRNAAQAEREAGRSGPVRAALARSAEGIELTIEDRGPGVPPAVRERLFHPFVTGRAGGVGLGLALAHRIVVLHGGSIRLEDRPGGGTRVRVVFPSPDDTNVTAGNVSAQPLPPPARPV